MNTKKLLFFLGITQIFSLLCTDLNNHTNSRLEITISYRPSSTETCVKKMYVINSNKTVTVDTNQRNCIPNGIFVKATGGNLDKKSTFYEIQRPLLTSFILNIKESADKTILIELMEIR